MPDLNLGPPPSRSPLPAVLIAAVILIAVACAVIFLNPNKPTQISVTRTKLYYARTEMKAEKGGVHVIGAPPSVEQNLYVLLTVKLDNKLRIPIFIKDEAAVLTAPDHSVTDVSALQKGELENLYLGFPEVKKLASTPLARDTQVAPGQSAEGMVLLHFPGLTEKDWNDRSAATLTLDLFHQGPQTITIPK